MTVLSTTYPTTSAAHDRCPWCSSVISRAKFLESQGKIREEEKKRLAEAEASMQSRLKAQEVAIRKAAQDETEQKFKVLLAQKDEQRKRELVDMRQILQKDRDQEVLKANAAFNREREGFQKKMKEMERQLERNTANQMGDGAELDLLDVLRETFLDDRITRIKKGEPGADIRHEVLYKGEVCGCIVIDSKNRQSWQNGYVTKLRQDQLDAEAEYGVLSTTVFPSGKKELCIEDEIIVASPARISHIVQLLRKAMIEMHVRGLTMKQREDKKSRLYDFIISSKYAQHCKEAQKLTRDILEVDVEEQRQHNNVWKKRGSLAKKIEHVLREIDTEISGILEGTEAVS